MARVYHVWATPESMPKDWGLNTTAIRLAVAGTAQPPPSGAQNHALESGSILATSGTMVRPWSPMVLVVSVLVPQVTQAQPSLAPSTAAPGTYSQYHTVPPLPFQLDSPVQFLPPPTQMKSEQEATDSDLTMRHDGFVAHVRSDGHLVFREDYLSLGQDAFGTPTLQFDLTDIAINLFGGSQNDPYLTQKLQLLNDTFEGRAEQRARHNQRTVDRALADLPAYLSAVWASELDAPEKRRILFALWDECAEGGNAMVAQAGAEARSIIEAFIRANLGENAYSSAELAQLNQSRSSRLAFSPHTPR